ncbi:MAG: serine/threonine protein kinase [Candidatus Obscuribacterales bacterium]|nr:serine/threonine protein kinase [Candidatus Obscuribacterales bacterium]
MTSTEILTDLDPTIFPVGRFKPIRKLKDNRIGGTMLCFDDFLEQNVVVKLIGEIDMDNLMRMHREALALCKLNNKGLAKLIDFGATTGGIAYLVYDYIAGENFRSYLDEQQPLTLQHTFKAFLPAVEALSSMHSNGILHCDLSCSNLLLINAASVDSSFVLLNSATGRPRAATREPITIEGRKIYGTPEYMSPEQVVLNEYDVHSEIFSLGCTVFEAITGRTPYEGDPEEAVSRMVRRGPPSLAQAQKGLSYPHKAEALIAKLLAKDPDNRFQTMQEVRHALKELSTQVLTVERRASPVRVSGPSQHDSNPESTGPEQLMPPRSRKQTGPQIEISTTTDESGNSATRQIEPDSVRLVVADSVEDLDQGTSEPPAFSPTVRIVQADDSKEMHQSGADPVSKPVTPRAKNQNSPHSNVPRLANSIANVQSVSSNTQLNAPAATFNVNFFVSSIPPSSPTFQLPKWAEGLTSSAKKGRNRALLVLFSLALIFCATQLLSYVSLVAAPRVTVEGIVTYYKPASNYTTGLVELQEIEDGTILPIVIERPEFNLPPIPTLDWNGTWNEDSSMQPYELWAQGPVLQIPGKRHGTIRLGEIWDLKFRIDNGKLILEDHQFDGIANGPQQLDDLESTIERMLKDLSRTMEGQPLDPLRESWSTPNFSSEVDLTTPNAGSTNRPFSPNEDLKLVDMSGPQCTLLVRSPANLEARCPYLQISMIRNRGWQVSRIIPATAAEWNRQFVDDEE